jgi:hypothetical protein
MDAKTAELTGAEDSGKWLPFIFFMDIVDAAKLSSDEEDSPTYGCTTIFTTQGDTYIIDTPYEKFFKLFSEWNIIQININDEDLNDDNDLEL